MKISISTKGLLDNKKTTAVLPLFKEEIQKKDFPGYFKKEITESLKKLFSLKDFKGKFGESYLYYPTSKSLPSRIFLFGLGERKKFDWETYREAVACITKTLEATESASITLSLPGEFSWREFNPLTAVREAAETITLCRYHFHHHRFFTKDSDRKQKPVFLSLHKKGNRSVLEKELKNGVIVGESTNLARDLVNHPSNYLTPTKFAQIASKVGNKKKLKSRILGPKEIHRLGMGGLLGVSRGSEEPPRFIILEYLPNKNLEKPLVFVGKGITFDTGGISIKPSAGMDQMKYDMAGGAAVVGAMAAISQLGIKRNVVGLVPTTENMPGGQAYKPGDVLKMYSGKTVEVLNTDAEGRLILADALAYALKYDPEAIIDLATLTGACVVALGEHAIGLMGNQDKLIQAIQTSGEKTFERAWQLPLWEEYQEHIKSSVADIQNIGGRSAGTITAAAFLKEFVGNKPWAHLDIAGTAWTDKEKPYHPKGATGVGVRLLTDLASTWKKK